MGRASYGPSIADGKVRYLSASSLTLADPDSEEGCLRKWWYEKVDGRKTESTGPQLAGVALHAEIERYLRKGVNALGSLALRGKFMIPSPGPDLLIEHDLLVPPTEPTAEGKLEAAPLRILNQQIPIVGYIDLLHSRGSNKGAPDIYATVDPPGTVEVLDWKTTSNPDYIKTPEAMARSIQMTLYGKWVTTTLPETSHVRLSHGYFVTRGTALPRKVSLRVSPEQIDQQWARVERVAGSIVDVVKATSAADVPANTRACGAYGGCPHRSYCSAPARDSLVQIFGPDGAENLIRRMSVNTVTPRTGKGLLTNTPRNMRDEMQRVAREEIETKYPGVPAAWDALQACNLGHPEFTGDLARTVGDLTGLVNVKHLDGVGELGTYGPFSDPTDLIGLVAEVKTFLVERNTITTTAPEGQVVELLPPEAPASDPALASKPPESSEPEPAKKGRGRPRKKQDQLALPMDVAATPSSTETGTFVSVPDVAPAAADKLFFYVNCQPSCTHVPFWPIVDEIVADMNGAAGDALDFRLVPNDHAFAYGRWKGAIAAALRSAELSPAHYVFRGATGEIATAVTEAMRSIVAARGGVFVE